jgi:isocitrate dehydrogenase
VESPPRAAHRRKITVEPAEAIRENGVGVKRAAVTPGEARVPEFNLKRIYKSPHRTLRNDTLHTNLQRPMAQ